MNWEERKLLQFLAFPQGLIHPFGVKSLRSSAVELWYWAWITVLDICGQERFIQIGKDTVMNKAVKSMSLQEGADRAGPA